MWRGHQKGLTWKYFVIRWVCLLFAALSVFFRKQVDWSQTVCTVRYSPRVVLPFSSPLPFSLLLAGAALARESKGYGDKEFPSPKLRDESLKMPVWDARFCKSLICPWRGCGEILLRKVLVLRISRGHFFLADYFRSASRGLNERRTLRALSLRALVCF